VSIVRAPRPERDYTTLRNEVIRDSRLSFRARGLLISMLSRPDNWRTSAEMLSKESPQGKEGRDAIRTALSELEAVGYLRRSRTQDVVTGHWSTDYILYDEAVESDKPDNTEDGFPVVGYPTFGEPVLLERTDKEEPNKKKELQPLAPLGVVTARDIVAAYVDEWNSLHSEQPLARQIGQLAREARQLLDAGFNPDRVIEAAKKCASDGHARLDSAYAWITANATRATAAEQPTRRDSNLHQGLSLAQRYAQQEQDQQQLGIAQ